MMFHSAVLRILFWMIWQVQNRINSNIQVSRYMICFLDFDLPITLDDFDAEIIQQVEMVGDCILNQSAPAPEPVYNNTIFEALVPFQLLDDHSYCSKIPSGIDPDEDFTILTEFLQFEESFETSSSSVDADNLVLISIPEQPVGTMPKKLVQSNEDDLPFCSSGSTNSPAGGKPQKFCPTRSTIDEYFLELDEEELKRQRNRDSSKKGPAEDENAD